MQKHLLVFIMITKLTFVLIKRSSLFNFLGISNHNMCVHVNFWHFKIRSFLIKNCLKWKNPYSQNRKLHNTFSVNHLVSKDA